MIPCKDCGAKDAPCFAWCGCSKCIDPVKYETWSRENPLDYQLWLARNS